jgi:GNAT superfamily N-acetyltransferase
MSPEYQIRRAKAEDVPELARLRWEFSNPTEHQYGQTLENFTDGFAEFWAGSVARGTWTVWVAEIKGELAGNMWLQHIEKVPHPGQPRVEYGYLTNVYVDPRHRNTGVGTKLLKRVVEWAKERQMEFLIVWPSRASVEFYERQGFTASGEAYELPL